MTVLQISFELFNFKRVQPQVRFTKIADKNRLVCDELGNQIDLVPKKSTTLPLKKIGQNVMSLTNMLSLEVSNCRRNIANERVGGGGRRFSGNEKSKNFRSGMTLIKVLQEK